MPTKKKITKKSPVKAAKKSVGELSKAETLEHFGAILLENVKSEFRLAFEKIDALDEKVDRFEIKVNRLENNMNSSFETIAKILHGHDKRFDEIREELSQINTKLDQQGNKIDEHNRDIELLKLSNA